MPQVLNKIKVLILLLLILLIACGCAYGRKIDYGIDYSSELRDGEYVAESEHYNTFGFKQILSFEVVKGIITKVNYQEIDRNGEVRYQENSTTSWTDCKLNYNQILDELYTETILSQGKDIDSITGATKTVHDYEILQNALLAQAKTGKEHHLTLNSFNDVYQVVNEVDPVTGSQEQITVEYSNGNLRTVTIKETTNNTALYGIGKAYESLADITRANKNLDPIISANVDTHILERYNNLLEQIRTLRG